MKSLNQSIWAIFSVTFLLFLAAGCGGKPKVDVPAQIQNLKSENAEARQNACIALAEAKELAASAVQPLVERLKDQDPLVRRLAAYALGEIGPKATAALPALKAALNDNDPSVIQAAGGAIPQIDPKQSVDAALPKATN